MILINRQNQSGFLLLEISLATLILGIFGCIVMAWQGYLIRAEAEIIQRIKAVSLARSLLENYKATGHMPSVKKKNGFSISWRIMPKDSYSNVCLVELSIGRKLNGMLKTYVIRTKQISR